MLTNHRYSRILRIGDFPGRCCTPLAGWLFDCLGVVPAHGTDGQGRHLQGGYTCEELRLVWLWEHRN